MTISKVLILFFMCGFLGMNAQDGGEEVKTYLRYDYSEGSKELSNFIKYTTKTTDSIASVEEYYRFTVPYQLKAKYSVNNGGLKEGAYVSYTINGDSLKSGSYHQDKREGIWLAYKEGKLIREEHYLNDERHGETKYFYNGDEFYTGNWIKGKIDGAKIKKDKEGNLIFEGQYQNGKLDSVNIWYFATGQKQFLRTYKDKKLNGIYQRWYKNGQLYSQGNYTNSNKTGTWEWYYENGSLASREAYNEKGKLKKARFYTNEGKEFNPRKNIAEGTIEEHKKLQRAIRKHIKENFAYPEAMHDKGFEAKIYVAFKVDKQGHIIDVETRGNAHASFLEKAEQIIKTLPKQKPSVLHNLPIEVPFTIPMVFKIQ